MKIYKILHIPTARFMEINTNIPYYLPSDTTRRYPYTATSFKVEKQLCDSGMFFFSRVAAQQFIEQNYHNMKVDNCEIFLDELEVKELEIED